MLVFVQVGRAQGIIVPGGSQLSQADAEAGREASEEPDEEYGEGRTLGCDSEHALTNPCSVIIHHISLQINITVHA